MANMNGAPPFSDVNPRGNLSEDGTSDGRIEAQTSGERPRRSQG